MYCIPFSGSLNSGTSRMPFLVSLPSFSSSVPSTRSSSPSSCQENSNTMRRTWLGGLASGTDEVSEIMPCHNLRESLLSRLSSCHYGVQTSSSATSCFSSSPRRFWYPTLTDCTRFYSVSRQNFAVWRSSNLFLQSGCDLRSKSVHLCIHSSKSDSVAGL